MVRPQQPLYSDAPGMNWSALGSVAAAWLVALACLAWFIVLPTVGLLYAVGWLQ